MYKRGNTACTKNTVNFFLFSLKLNLSDELFHERQQYLTKNAHCQSHKESKKIFTLSNS